VDAGPVDHGILRHALRSPNLAQPLPTVVAGSPTQRGDAFPALLVLHFALKLPVKRG
jgi:hypothetical protein